MVHFLWSSASEPQMQHSGQGPSGGNGPKPASEKKSCQAWGVEAVTSSHNERAGPRPVGGLRPVRGAP